MHVCTYVCTQQTDLLFSWRSWFSGGMLSRIAQWHTKANHKNKAKQEEEHNCRVSSGNMRIEAWLSLQHTARRSVTTVDKHLTLRLHTVVWVAWHGNAAERLTVRIDKHHACTEVSVTWEQRELFSSINEWIYQNVHSHNVTSSL